tara:strand:- start:277 stop:651 length:375 start_codon:yes stop_codon:yes gene_type:complete
MMEISGDVNIEIDQMVDVMMYLDVEQLAETLCRDHDFVDDVRVEDMVQEEIAGVRLDVSDNTDAIHELRDQVSELQPNNNYVRINDLHKIIEEIVRAEICVAFAAGHHKMQDRLNGTDIEIREG